MGVTHVRRFKAGLAVVVLGVLAAGCGKAVTPGSPPEPGYATGGGGGSAIAGLPGGGIEGRTMAMSESCVNDPRLGVDLSTLPADRTPVPDGFATVWVLRCNTELRDVPGQGKWLVQVAQRADTTATELVAELRKPSDARTAQACTLEMAVPPYFVLVDAAGKAVVPTVPTDPCGKPRRAARTLVEALPFRTLFEKQLNQVQSQESIDSNCPESWKDMITIAKDARPAPATAIWSDPVTDIKVCVYDRISEGQLPVGQLRSVRAVSGDGVAGLRAALDKAGPAMACSAPHTRFAVLRVDGAAGWAQVELDGCYRVLRTDNTLGQLDAAAVALIA